MWIIIQQKNKASQTMVRFPPIQIFPQHAEGATMAYYPYFFSTNIDFNYYNCYPSSSLPAFQLQPASNIVYAPQILAPLPASLENLPTHTSFSPDPSASPDSPPPINSPPQQIVRLCNRNVLPNNVSLALCFIRRIKKSGKMVDRLVARLSPQGRFTSKKFYAYHAYLRDNRTDFKWKQGVEVLVNHLDASCSAFSLEEQAFYNRVSRILIAQYLEEIARLDVLLHSKINPSHIRDHLRVIRYLRHSLRPHPKPRMAIQYI